jgi:hypothetical protein
MEQGLLLNGIDRGGHGTTIDQGVQNPVAVLADAAQAKAVRIDQAMVGAQKAVDASTTPPLLPQRRANTFARFFSSHGHRGLLGRDTDNRFSAQVPP